jgi:ATP-dependent DNA helicase PIF1
MSLTRVNVDVAKAFDYGQVYVALSRARTKEGLWLSGPPLHAGAVRAHTKVKNFYVA